MVNHLAQLPKQVLPLKKILHPSQEDQFIQVLVRVELAQALPKVSSLALPEKIILPACWPFSISVSLA